LSQKVIIDNYITPICEILTDKNIKKTDWEKHLRQLIYHARKINNRHLQKGLTVDQTVGRLLQSQWRTKVRRFDPKEWRKTAEDIRKRAIKLLGRAAPPEIIRYPGFGGFNGRVYKLDGRPVIGCSPDFPRTTGDNLQVLLAHEYAHFIRWRKTGVPSESGPIYSFIYEEGWATWLSIKLMPELDINTMFMSNLHNMINMPNPFQCMRFKDDSTPIRVGYYLGYRLIEMLSEKYTIGQLMYLKPRVKEIERWLEEMVR